MKIFKQETEKSCGVACLRSVLNSFGNEFSEKDIWDRSDVYKKRSKRFRNPILSLGAAALRFGAIVEYVGYEPLIANNNSSKDLVKSLEEKSRKNYDYGKYYVDQALEFLKLGGRIRIDKLSLKTLKQIVRDNKIVLVEVKPALLKERALPNRHHKIIITGYTAKGFKYLDPADAKEHVLDFDSFLLAFYACNPELLIIKKRR